MTILEHAWRFPLPFMLGDSYFKSKKAGAGGGGEGREYLPPREIALFL